MFDILLGHLVGDYLLQNDWMATGKKKSSFVCAVHCAIWTCCVFVFWFGPWAPWRTLNLLVPLWLFATHFAIDRCGFIGWWMRIAGQENFAKAPLAPWSCIVVDNVFHLLTIWVAFQAGEWRLI